MNQVRPNCSPKCIPIACPSTSAEGNADQPAEDADADTAEEEDSDEEAAPRRTIAQQLESCGQSTAIVEEIETMNEQTGELSTRYEFRCKINTPLRVVLAIIQHQPLNRSNTRAVLIGDLSAIQGMDGQTRASVSCDTPAPINAG